MRDDAIHREARAIEAQIGKSPNQAWYASKLDSMGYHASPLQRKRFDLAVAYLEHHFKQPGGSPGSQSPADREKVLAHLKGIDFHKDVRLRRIRQGRQLRNFQPEPARNQPTGTQHPGREFQQNTARQSQSGPGEFFTQSGYPAERLAIASGAGDQTRRAQAYQVDSDVLVLQTHTAPIVDTYSQGRKVREPQKSIGGIPIENKDEYQRIDRDTGRRQDMGLRPTSQASQATRTYRVEKTGGEKIVRPKVRNLWPPSSPRVHKAEEKKVIQARSGEYRQGGGIQFHMSESQSKRHLVRHDQRHRQGTPSPSRKRPSTTREQRISPRRKVGGR